MAKLLNVCIAVMACLALAQAATTTGWANLGANGANGYCYISIDEAAKSAKFFVSLKGITDIDMIHIHEGKSANSGAPIINLFPLGSTAFPSGVSPFKIPAGMTYTIAGSFNESALELAVETVGPTYNVAKFVTDAKAGNIYCAVHYTNAAGNATAVAGDFTANPMLDATKEIEVKEPSAPTKPTEAKATFAGLIPAWPATGFCYVTLADDGASAGVWVSIKTKAPITAMHIHNGTLNPDAQGPVGVQLYPSNATLTTYTPDDTLTVYVPVDAAALAKDVYPDMAAFIKAFKANTTYCAVHTAGAKAGEIPALAAGELKTGPSGTPLAATPAGGNSAAGAAFSTLMLAASLLLAMVL